MLYAEDVKSDSLNHKCARSRYHRLFVICFASDAGLIVLLNNGKFLFPPDLVKYSSVYYHLQLDRVIHHSNL